MGQADELEGLEERALKTGAAKLIVADLTDEMVDDVIIPPLKAGASMRPICWAPPSPAPSSARSLAEIALEGGRRRHLPRLHRQGQRSGPVRAGHQGASPRYEDHRPWRDVGHQTRDEEIDYAEGHNVPLKITRETNYSKDKNLWHLSHEGLDLEDPANEPNYDKPGFLEMGVSPSGSRTPPPTSPLTLNRGARGRGRREDEGL